MSLNRRLLAVLLDAQSAQDTVAYFNEADVANVTEFGFHIEFGPGTSAGVVVVETASSRAYTGTWANLATVTWAAASKSHYVGITDAVACLRLRISTAIVGGTVSGSGVGNG